MEILKFLFKRNSAIKKYVLGFAFSKDKKNIVLIQKNRPEKQRGFLNGVGGKVEKYDKSSTEAMVFEFQEETGVITFSEDWNLFGEMISKENNYIVYLFRMFNDDILFAKTMETEEIEIININDFNKFMTLNSHLLLPDLKVLIPLALNTAFKYTILNV